MPIVRNRDENSAKRIKKQEKAVIIFRFVALKTSHDGIKTKRFDCAFQAVTQEQQRNFDSYFSLCPQQKIIATKRKLDGAIGILHDLLSQLMLYQLVAIARLSDYR